MTISSSRRSPDVRRTGTKISPMFSDTCRSLHSNSTTGSVNEMKYKIVLKFSKTFMHLIKNRNEAIMTMYIHEYKEKSHFITQHKLLGVILVHIYHFHKKKIHVVDQLIFLSQKDNLFMNQCILLLHECFVWINPLL